MSNDLGGVRLYFMTNDFCLAILTNAIKCNGIARRGQEGRKGIRKAQKSQRDLLEHRQDGVRMEGREKVSLKHLG